MEDKGIMNTYDERLLQLVNVFSQKIESHIWFTCVQVVVFATNTFTLCRLQQTMPISSERSLYIVVNFIQYTVITCEVEYFVGIRDKKQ